MPRRTESTKEFLARELKAAGHQLLGEQAGKGEYDDYESEHAMPKRLLVGLLRVRKDERFAQRVIRGEFESTKEEANVWLEGVGSIYD